MTTKVHLDVQRAKWVVVIEGSHTSVAESWLLPWAFVKAYIDHVAWIIEPEVK